jgi:trans-2-enoyl-CoA reductase
MHKLQITAIGEPADVLQLVEFQAPAPGPGQVLVEVEAATINASDFLYITGQYFITPQPPSDVGAEGVGRVLAVGPGENESLVGARVLLLPTYGHGTWATHLIAATTDIVVVPDDIDAIQLAMVGINPITALLLLRSYGDPSMDDRWIGQTAGNSAVGEYLIKLARRFGWKTMSVVRREAAAEQVRSWGGDRVAIDDDNLESNLAQSLSGAELDIVVDSVGGRAARELAHQLRFGGTVVSYAVLSGQSASVPVLELIGRQLDRILVDQLATQHRHRGGAQHLSRAGGAGRRRHTQCACRPHCAAGRLERGGKPRPGRRRPGGQSRVCVQRATLVTNPVIQS